MSYSLVSATDIFKIFASNMAFEGRAIKLGQSNSTTTYSCCYLNIT